MNIIIIWNVYIYKHFKNDYPNVLDLNVLTQINVNSDYDVLSL